MGKTNRRVGYYPFDPHRQHLVVANKRRWHGVETVIIRCIDCLKAYGPKKALVEVEQHPIG